MKKINTYILMIIGFALPQFLQAQESSRFILHTENARAIKLDNKVFLYADIPMDSLNLGRQEVVALTPVLYSADSTRFHQFSPIVIAGGTRYRALDRGIGLGNLAFEESPQAVLKHNDHRGVIIPLELSVMYEDWMNNSRFMIYENLKGCACDNKGSNRHMVLAPVLPIPYAPRFEVAYITPPVEEIKERSETHKAHINFRVNRYEILQNFKNNAEILGEVDMIITNVSSDPNLKVNQFAITGYASPEGNEQSNMTLSKNRATSFVSYLRERYNLDPAIIQTDWKGEDWEGLREVVAQLNISDKDQVLAILDGESNVATRKRRLQQLSGGTTYRMLLNDYYPSLRRNEYTISYTVKQFDLTEARQIIKTKPQHLSLHEMFLVANSYPKDSNDYKEVYRIIEHLYPNDEIALLNSSGAQLEQRAANTVIMKLQRINRAEAWNNLGIAYFQNGDYERAEEYLNRAPQAGLRVATQNLTELDKYKRSITVN